MRIVIVGGVAGGATAAARLRRLDEKAEIVILERGRYISYANCGLPYYIGEKIKERENIIVQTPESLSLRYNVDIRIRNEAVRLDREKRELTVMDLETRKEYQLGYDKLILSPGAEPLEPPILGVNGGRVFTLRSVPDADNIKEFIKQHNPKRAIVVGGGYIGLEMAENLSRRGILVTVVEMANQVIAPLDFEMAAEVHQHLRSKNVEFYLGEQVMSFEEEGNKVAVKLKSGLELKTDFILLSVGIKPEVKLAKEAGIRIGDSGGIWVNDHMQTSDGNVYAVGDAVETFDPILKIRKLVPLAGPANKQARVAANNIILGNEEKYSGSVGTAIAKVFDITVGVTGFSEKHLRQNRVEYLSAIVHSVSNAGYYPGAMPLTIKINFARGTGKLLGAQVVGFKGVDKATETLSAMCQFGLTINELKDMDQAYAPPYSTAKSIVNMAGFVADDLLKGLVKNISWQEVEQRGDDVFLLDVRNREEAALGIIPGAVNIPVNEIRKRIKEIPKDKKIYVYCAVGLRGYIAARIISQNGYKEVASLSGGYRTWENAVMRQSNEDIFDKYKIDKDDVIYQKEPEKEKHVVDESCIELDARGLQCPGPVLKLNEKIGSIREGDSLKITVTDPGFINDIKSWCNVTGNVLMDMKQEKGEFWAVVKKQHLPKAGAECRSRSTDKTIIVFNDDMDKAMAAFVIANGALAMGRKVTIFFTFWGLNVIKKDRPPFVSKNFMGRMFSLLMPKGPDSLKLSKMNMFGLGPRIMKGMMKAGNIDTLDELMKKAVKGGAELLACQMSMDAMGIKKEELIDGVKISGVASYIEASESSNMNLFI